MFRRLHGTRFALLLISTLVLLASASVAVSAVVGVEVSLGVGERVVRGHYSPVRVTLSAVEDGTEGAIVVSQLTGDVFSDQETMTAVIYRGTLEDRTYEATIPIFEPLNPLEVSVEDTAGHVLRAVTLNPRLMRRVGPFPAVCGPTFEIGLDTVLIDAGEIPRDWWGLHAVRQLWIGGNAVPSADAWRTIAEWVLAGGSLVVLSGTDFYRLDSPDLRDLMPIGNPELVELSGGRMRVQGTLKEGAVLALENESETWSAASWKYGSGEVTFVSASSDDLGQADIETIGSMAGSTEIPSIEGAGASALGSMEVIKPWTWFAPLVLLLGTLAYLVFARIGVSRPRLAWVLLCGALVGLSVWSGFASRRTKHVIDLYVANTSVKVQGEYGIAIGWSSFYANRSRMASIGHEAGSFPIQSLEETVFDSDFSVESEASATKVLLQAHEYRGFELYRRSQSFFHVTYENGRVTIENPGEKVVEDAVLIVEGKVYELPPIPSGTFQSTLSGGIPEYLFSSRRVADDRIIRQYSDVLSYDESVWLVVSDEHETVTRSGEWGEKVRASTVTFILGESR